MSDQVRVSRLIDEMTLPEKVGQMAQMSQDAVTPAEIADFGVGSVLSGGGGNPTPNDPARWADMVDAALGAAADSRLGIPLVYGTDAVHGHSNVRGATIFPHNIGLGAAGDADLVARIGRATAVEMAATGARWNFAPVVAVATDARWGRSYESFGCDPELVGRLGAACVTGLQGTDLADPASVLACAKHYVGDGATSWGTAPRIDWVDWWDPWGDDWRIDQGDAVIDEDELRAVHLAPYRAALDAGARTVMASYSSWRGEKLHGHRYLLDDVLKGGLGFGGLVVSDWMAIDQLDPDYRTCVVRAVNAGLDMVMVPFDLRRFVAAATEAVADGDIPLARIDDAVRRILAAKSALGLFDNGGDGERPALATVGCPEHRELARDAVRRSAVLLANDRALPIAPGASLLVAGEGADDIGSQCGGWTVEWQGGRGPITPGTTLLDALRSLHGGPVAYDAAGRFDAGVRADVGVVVVAEEPYAEGPGDRPDLALDGDHRAVLDRLRSHCDRIVLVVYSGRPVAIPGLVEASDAVVAAWLPGTEAAGVADLLLGHPFTGRLAQPWPRDAAADAVLYPVGHGL